MKRLFYGCMTLSLILLFFTGELAGDSEKPNFSGTWHYNPEKSKLQLPKPESLTMTIEHNEPEFKLFRTYAGSGVTDEWGITLTTDGKESIHQEGPQTLYCRLYWEDDQLVFATRIIQSGKEATNVVKYSISSDGQTFTAQESFRGPRMKYDNLWVLDRK